MITVSINSVVIPIMITLILFSYAIFIHNDEPSNYFSGIGNLLLLIPASIISLICWVVWAILK